MNFRSIILMLYSAVFFFSCQTRVQQPEDILTYKTSIVINEPAPFLLNFDANLERSSSSRVEIEESPPDGTVYGHYSEPDNVYQANGSELLPAGAWTDHVNDHTYRLHLNENSILTFEQLTSLNITNAVNCQYLSESDEWITVNGDLAVQAKAVKSGENESADVAVSLKCSIGGNGDNK